MKKLMIAAVAMAGLTAVASGIQSANIVGYSSSANNLGTTYQGPTFVAIGDGKLSDYKVTGYTGDVAEELVTVSKINSFGVNTKDVIWLDYAEMGLYGWYQYDGVNDPVDCNDDPLSAGDCLMVQVQSGAVGWTVTSAGQVAKDGVAVTLVAGTQYLANAVPRSDTTLGDVVISGYEGDVAEELVTISKINSFGVNTKDVIWLDYTDMDLYGWYQYDGVSDPIDCNSDELAAGQGLMVQAQAGAVGWTITFPAAYTSAE